MLVFKGTFGTYNCPKQFLSIPLGVAVTGWKRFHAALFRPCQADIAQSIMCSPCLAHNGLQALFGLAVITSGNRNKAYIKLTWSKAIRYPNGFLWSWHGAVWVFFFKSSLFIAFIQEEGDVADKDTILKGFLLSSHVNIKYLK